MKVVQSIDEISLVIKSVKSENLKIGLVPTMGALHEGHLSLLRKAKKDTDFVAVSIFVNPTQFDKEEDLLNYPKTLENDLALLKEAACDLVFAPNAKEIYNKNIKAEKFDFDGLENEMEGRFRDGHFDGVGTIVKKFFEIIQPDHAYFGEKDFQQLQIIKKLTEKLSIPVKILGCPIHREKDGLAMSSRNSRLTTEQRIAAPHIYKTLLSAKEMFTTKSIKEINKWVSTQFETHALLELEYFEIANEADLKTCSEKKENTLHRAFIAVYAGNVRLIDTLAFH